MRESSLKSKDQMDKNWEGEEAERIKWFIIRIVDRLHGREPMESNNQIFPPTLELIPGRSPWLKSKASWGLFFKRLHHVSKNEEGGRLKLLSASSRRT
jgi:hypothetical protein